jgi:cytochrome c biogenesis protein CcdA
MIFMSFLKHLKTAFLLILCAAIAGSVLVSLWALFESGFSGAGELGTFGWFAFALVSGALMIATPCTLPLVYVVVPHTLTKGTSRGFSVLISFALGLVTVLTLYGVLFSGLGKAGLDTLGLGAADIERWIYFLGGSFVFVFALGELGLFRFHLLPFEGSVPKFIEKRKGYAKPLLLGLFLGNIGVGCLHPAIVLLLIEAAAHGDIYYGAILLFAHAIGRVLTLLFLVIFAATGVNPLRALAEARDLLLAKAGWFVVIASGFLITLGLFGSQWWVASGQQNLVQALMLQTWFYDVFPVNFLNVGSSQLEGGLFGQPLYWGGWLLVTLWTFPLWRRYYLEFRRIFGSPILELRKLERKAEEVEHERRALELAVHLTEGKSGELLKRIEGELDMLLKKRAALEEGIRYGATRGLWGEARQKLEENVLAWRFRTTVILTALFLVVFVYYLPTLS